MKKETTYNNTIDFDYESVYPSSIGDVCVYEKLREELITHRRNEIIDEIIHS